MFSKQERAELEEMKRDPPCGQERSVRPSACGFDTGLTPGLCHEEESVADVDIKRLRAQSPGLCREEETTANAFT